MLWMVGKAFVSEGQRDIGYVLDAGANMDVALIS